jgi:hypothetical protein
MPLEGSLIVGRKEIPRSPPRPFALDHRVDGDVTHLYLSDCHFLLEVAVSRGRLMHLRT